jgi:hypothetical protein
MISFKKYGLRPGKCEILNILGPSLEEWNIPDTVYGKFPLVNIKIEGEWETVICMMGRYANLDPRKQVILPWITHFSSGHGLIYPEISFTTKELACQFFNTMKVISQEEWENMRYYGCGTSCEDRTFRCYDHV